MQDLTDVTVVIPYREDTPDRRRNLTIILDYFQRNFSWKQVLLVEQSTRPAASNLQEKYSFLQHVARRSDAVFHKSRLLNLGIALADTEYALVYDADVLFDPDALRKAAWLLRSKNADFVFPFNQVMLQIKQETIDGGVHLDSDFITCLPVCGAGDRLDDPNCEHLYGEPGDPCAGGALMFNRRAMLLHGGYNENIVSYSCEDVELLSRLKILGANWSCLPDFCCYHIPHRRGEDSRYNNFHDMNLSEWDRVRNMARDQLWRYVYNGFRNVYLQSSSNYALVNDEHGYAVEYRDDDRIDLSDLGLVFYIDKEACLEPDQVRETFMELNRHFVNYEIFLYEGIDDLFRGSRHTPYMNYFRLNERQIPAWREIGLAQSVRRRVICIDLRSADIDTVQGLLKDQLGTALSNIILAPGSGIAIIDRPPEFPAETLG